MASATKIRYLEQQLAECDSSFPADRIRKVDILNDLAWALSDTDLQRAYSLAETAYALANAPDDGAPPYQAGMAYSLRTQGYVNQRLGDYPLGLAQLLKARGIFESLQIDDGLPDVFDGIAGIYGQSGDYPEALSFMHQQLDAAQRVGDKRRIANAYNNLAVIYHATGDFERTIETLHHNLQLAAELDYMRIEFLSYANLAGTYLTTGDYEKALENAWRGLHVSQGAGFELFEVHAFDLIGRCYLKLRQYPQAIHFLEQAAESARRLNAKPAEALVLLTMGEGYREMQQPDRALECLQQSAAVAQSVGDKGGLVRAHLQLSQVYELQGDFAQALAHLQQHNTVKELVSSEEAKKRLRVLQVTHDTETARQEAEILRLKSQQLQQQIDEQNKVEKALQDARDELDRLVTARTSELRDAVALLQKEIAERERAEAEIQQLVQTLEQRIAVRTEELATFFDLTLLAGQAVNLADVFEQVLPRIIEVTRSRAICIHLLDADGATMRLVAQQSLPGDIRAQLQSVELSPDFRRWLQKPNDPLVSMALSGMTMLPAVLHLPGFETYLGVQIRIGPRIEGIISCFRFTSRGFSVDEIALVTALAEQMGMMSEVHRLRQHAEAMAVVVERQRLARDLHDSVTQSLYSLSLFSRAGREAAEDGDTERLAYSLTELERTTLHALREMRLLLYELRPADLEQEGLNRAVELRLNIVERRVGLQLDAHLEELPGLTPGQEVELYHIIVEALNNVTKHAAASRLAVQLTHANSSIHLRIADDGQGFDPSQTNGGLGLRNIRERVSKLNGSLTIASELGQGTQVEVVIPCGTEVH